MIKLVFISLSILMISCFRQEKEDGIVSVDNKDRKLNIKNEMVEKILFNCSKDTVLLNSAETILLLNKINSAKEIGMVKGIVNQNLTIYLKNNDTLNLSLLGNLFKWNKNGDWAFELKMSPNYFTQKCDEISSKKLENLTDY